MRLLKLQRRIPEWCLGFRFYYVVNVFWIIFINTKDTNNLCSNVVPRTTGKNKFSSAWCVTPSTYNFIPLIAPGALPFSIGKKYQAEAVRRDYECL